MYLDAALAYLHYLSIFFLALCLVREWSLIRHAPASADLHALTRIDLGFGLAAAAVLASGLGRLLLGAKPLAFYTGNPVFHTKVGLFVLIGLISIQPTLAFRRWHRAYLADPAYRVAPNDWRRTRRMLSIELHLLLLMPLLAVLMARGIGLHAH